jgi:hypothetical protein
LYGGLARRYRQQVLAVLIRELPERPMSMDRRRRAFRGLPQDRCFVFRSPEELSERVPCIRASALLGNDRG